MTNEEAIKMLQTEKACVERQERKQSCNRYCESCDLCMPIEDVIDGYNTAIRALKNEQTDRKFEKIVVDYPPAELCVYPEYKGKPYFLIKYEENGKHIIGFGTYKPEVLSEYLREYFIAQTNIENVGEMSEKQTDGDLISRQDAIDIVEYECGEWTGLAKEISKQLRQLPSAENADEWCHSCKEYDHEKNCCPRFNKVIRQTMNDKVDSVLGKIKAEMELFKSNEHTYDYGGFDRAYDGIKEIINKHISGKE